MKTKIHTLIALVIITVAGLVGCTKRDPVPISVTFRVAMLDNSLVAKFRNTSNRYLTPVVTLKNKTLNQSKEFYIKIGPDEQQEFGWAEGWSFVSGEYITIRHEDYSDLEIHVP